MSGIGLFSSGKTASLQIDLKVRMLIKTYCRFYKVTLREKEGDKDIEEGKETEMDEMHPLFELMDT